MTFSDELNPNKTEGFGEESDYPTAFGITFTPKVSGIVLGVLGVLGSGYLLMNMVLPAHEKYQTLKTDQQAKEDQLEQLKAGKVDQKIAGLNAQLQEAESLKSQVLALFANEKTKNTLLLDINSLVKERKAKLINFQPDPSDAAPISDSSLGAGVNNKLKRQSISLQIEGTFEQTESFLQDLERLQPLLLVRDLSSELTTDKIPMTAAFNQGKLVLQGKESPKLKTTFRLDMIAPLNQQELAQLAPPPAPEEPAKQ